MVKLSQTLAIFSLLLSASCVGTDLIDDPIIAEKLTISPRIDSLTVGKEQVFTTKFTNKYGIEETPKALAWRSSDPTKISIDATGKAKVLATGKATIYASNGNVVDSLVLNKNSNSSTGGSSGDTTFLKTGTFQAISGSYSIKGKVTVRTVKGKTEIVTSPDFAVSAGPSLYLLLTNNTNGRYTVTPGANAVNAISAQITPNRLSVFSGSLTWVVPTNIVVSDYRYVTFYCSLGPVFGTAELQ
ncbi:MAG: Ig-like domain-containing protein [Saprospiraceae bacterium]|nr:Ig-like domain-containing protein [Saprospiraceae bacterium]